MRRCGRIEAGDCRAGILHTTEPSLKQATIAQIVAHLEKTYCGNIGVEFEFMVCAARRPRQVTVAQDEPERKWFAAAFEAAAHAPVTAEEQQRTAELLVKCDTFDNFMQVRYASVKRYGAEVCPRHTTPACERRRARSRCCPSSTSCSARLPVPALRVSAALHVAAADALQTL